MAKTRFDFVTPVGRLVGGSFYKLNETDHENKPIAPEKFNWWAGLAFPKTAANWWDEPGELGLVFTAMRSAAAEFKNGEAGQPTFAWKVVDGDLPKHANKEGYPGHWVIGFSRNVVINACDVYTYPDNRKVIDPQQAVTGDYFRISGSSSPNGRTGNQAGIYVNMDMAQLVYKGQPIQTGPAPSSVFSGSVAMPAGATPLPAGATPLPAGAANAPAPGGQPVTPPAPGGQPVTPPAPGGQPVTPPAPGGQPVTPPAPGGQPVTPPAPGGQPVTPPAPGGQPVTPPAPPAAPVHVMTAKANGLTYEQYIGANWTDAQLIEQGMMLPPTTPAPNFLTGNGY